MAQTNRICFRIIIEQRKEITVVDKKGFITSSLHHGFTIMWRGLSSLQTKALLVISMAAWIMDG